MEKENILKEETMMGEQMKSVEGCCVGENEQSWK